MQAIMEICVISTHTSLNVSSDLMVNGVNPDGVVVRKHTGWHTCHFGSSSIGRDTVFCVRQMLQWKSTVNWMAGTVPFEALRNEQQLLKESVQALLSQIERSRQTPSGVKRLKKSARFQDPQ